MSGALGTIPDIAMGKDPLTALRDNAIAVTATLTGANALQGLGAMGGAEAAGGVPPNPFAAPSGLLDKFKTAGEYIKPIGQAAGAANSAGLLGGQQQPIMPSPIQQPQPGANQTLASIAQMPSMGTQQMQEAEQMRQRRRMGLLGGGM